MTLDQNSSEINPDHITDYLYENAHVDDGGFIDVHALLSQLRQDFGEVDYFTPDNNPNSDFAVAVFNRATKHNSARFETLAAEADIVTDGEPVNGPRGWLLPNIIAALTGLLVTLSPVLALAAMG